MVISTDLALLEHVLSFPHCLTPPRGCGPMGWAGEVWQKSGIMW